MTIVEYEPLPASRPGDELAAGPTGLVARLRAHAEYANYIAGTGFVPEPLRNKPAEVAAAIMYGDEIGLGPMRSLAWIAIVKGRPALLAEAQRALIAAAGHELWFDETTATRCIAAGRRHGSDRIGRITWTIDDAKRAGLAGQPNYRTYPAEMLRARASAALARAMFPDVIGGLAAVEELEGLPDNGTPPPAAADDVHIPIDVEKTTSSRTRKRKPKAAPDAPATRPPLAPTPPPDLQPEPELEPAEPLATEPQKRIIYALMRDVGFPTSDRDARLAYAARVVGHDVTSSNDLTVREAGLVIQDLQEIALLPAGEPRNQRLFSQTETETLAALDELTEPEAPEVI